MKEGLRMKKTSVEKPKKRLPRAIGTTGVVLL